MTMVCDILIDLELSIFKCSVKKHLYCRNSNKNQRLNILAYRKKSSKALLYFQIISKI